MTETKQATENKNQFEVQANGETIKLSPKVVRDQLVSGDSSKVTNGEIVSFMALCKFQHLNPFLNEAYLVKYGNSPASIITSKEAFVKRANMNPHFKGSQAGIIVDRNDEIKKLNGAVKLPKDKLIGGWAEVERDDRNHPISVEVALDEFSKGQATWEKMPMNMIRKVALVNALREAFPEQLGALYTDDEPHPQNDKPKDVTASAQEHSFEDVSDLINNSGNEANQATDGATATKVATPKAKTAPKPTAKKESKKKAEQAEIKDIISGRWQTDDK